MGPQSDVSLRTTRSRRSKNISDADCPGRERKARYLAAEYVNIVWFPIGVFLCIEIFVGIFSEKPLFAFSAFEKPTFPNWAEASARL